MSPFRSTSSLLLQGDMFITSQGEDYKYDLIEMINWTKMAQFLLSSTLWFTFSKSLRVKNKDFRVSDWNLYKLNVSTLHYEALFFFLYQPSFSQKQWVTCFYLSMFTFSRRQNKHGSIVRTGFNCRNLMDVLTISTRGLQWE